MSRQRFMFILGALGAAVALSATVASAQQRSSPVRPPSASAPSGSYQQSCRGINMNGNMLSAQCTNSSGAPVFSSLDTNSCRGRDISNDNGYLRCGSGGGPVPPTPPRPTQPPSGSYQQSCRGISMSGNTLRAQCTNEQGRPVSSSLDLNGCRGKEVYNDNGYLRCGVAAPVRPVPPVPPVGGGGSFEAIAYTSANFGGRQLRIREPIANLGNFPGFNDNIRSIRILRGRAEVCTDARYRGQCRTISQSVGDLNRIGMGNRISSIR